MCVKYTHMKLIKNKIQKTAFIITTLYTCLVLQGCVTGEATRTSSRSYASTNPSSVQILFETPSRKYEVIGHVSSEGARLSSRDANFRMLQTQAAKLGADAVLVQGEGVEDVQEWGQYNHKAANGLALKWRN